MKLRPLNLELKRDLEDIVRDALKFYSLKSPMKNFTTIIRSANINKLRVDYVNEADEVARKIFDIHAEISRQTHFGRVYEMIVEEFKLVRRNPVRIGNVKGIDYVIETDEAIYVISHKSGPNWGNSSQIRDMERAFNAIRKFITDKKVICVNTCSYGVDDSPYKSTGKYHKLCGERCWEFYSGDPNFYQQLSNTIANVTRQLGECNIVVNKADSFLHKFNKFCTNRDGTVDWQMLMKINSAKNFKFSDQYHWLEDQMEKLRFSCEVCSREMEIEKDMSQSHYDCCGYRMVEVPVHTPMPVCTSTDTAEHSRLDGGDPCDDGRSG